MKKIKLQNLVIGLIIASALPFLWLFTQARYLGGLAGAFGNIAGLLGTLLILWQFILGLRFTFRSLTVDFVRRTKIHKALGKYGLLLIFVHPFLQMVNYGENLAFVFLPNTSTPFYTSVGYGRYAFYLLLTLWLTSAILRDKMKFRTWRYLHYLAYPTLFWVALHAQSIGTFLNTFPFIRAYWQGLILIYYVFLVWKLATVFNLNKHKFILQVKKSLPGGITHFTFKPLGKTITPKPGQFAYLKYKFFSEAHPFTIAQFDKKTGELSFAIKTEGKFTKSLSEVREGGRVFIEGPYGVFTEEGHNPEPKVILAAGVGITPFIEFVNRYGDAQTQMIYANQKLANAVKREDFKKKLGKNYLDVVSREKAKEEGVISGHVDKNLLTKFIKPAFFKKAKFFVCGGGRFIKDMQALLISLSVPSDRIYFEEFSL